MATKRVERPESEIVKAIEQYLSLRSDVWVMRMNTGAMFGAHKGKRWAVRFGVPGMSDFLGYKIEWVNRRGDPGITASSPLPRFLAIEVKTPGWKPTDAESRARWAKQEAFLQRITVAGGIAFVAHSVTEVMAQLGDDGR